MKKFDYYYDYTEEALKYILSSKLLRNRDKKILMDLIAGKKSKEIAYENKCSYRTIINRRKEIFTKTKEFM